MTTSFDTHSYEHPPDIAVRQLGAGVATIQIEFDGDGPDICFYIRRDLAIRIMWANQLELAAAALRAMPDPEPEVDEEDE